MNRELAAFAATLLVLALATLSAVGLREPIVERYHGDHYLVSVRDKDALLAATSEEDARLLLFGGSGTAFSLDSHFLARRLGVRTLNLGVHAGLPVERSWNRFRSRMDPASDIVVVALEYGVLEGELVTDELFCRMLFLAGGERFPRDLACAADFVVYLRRDLSGYLRERLFGTPPLGYESGIYLASGFDAITGDFVGHLGDPQSYAPESTPGAHSAITGALAEDGEFDAVTAFVEGLREAGFRAFFLPPVVAASACDGRDEALEALHGRIAGALGQPAPTALSACLPDDQFLDTEYHANESGRALRTRQVQAYLAELMASEALAP